MLKVGDKVRVTAPKLPENFGVEGVVTEVLFDQVRMRVTKIARSGRYMGEIVRFDTERCQLIANGFSRWYKEHRV